MSLSKYNVNIIRYVFRCFPETQLAAKTSKEDSVSCQYSLKGLERCVRVADVPPVRLAANQLKTKSAQVAVSPPTNVPVKQRSNQSIIA